MGIFSTITQGLLRLRADVAAGIAFTRGWSIGKVKSMLTKRTGVTSAIDLAPVIDLGQKSSRAATQANARGLSGEIVLTDIPINEYLYGEETAGRRIHLTVNVRDAEDANPARWDLDLEDAVSWEDVIESFAATVRGQWAQYDELVAKAREDQWQHPVLEALNIIRGF